MNATFNDAVRRAAGIHVPQVVDEGPRPTPPANPSKTTGDYGARVDDMNAWIRRQAGLPE